MHCKTLGLIVGGGFWVASWVALPSTQAAEGDPDENPYKKSIVDRNAFELKDPPPPQESEPEPDPPEPDPPPSVDATLTGFSRIAGTKRVYLMLPDPEDNNRYRFLTLEENQAEQGIEVLEIQLEQGQVRILNQKQPMTLTMEEHGYKVAKNQRSSRSQSQNESGSGSSNSSSKSRSGPLIIQKNPSDQEEEGSDDRSGSSSGGSGNQSRPQSSPQRDRGSGGGRDSRSDRAQASSPGARVIGSSQNQEAEHGMSGVEKAAEQKASMAVQRERMLQEYRGEIPMPPVPGMEGEGDQ